MALGSGLDLFVAAIGGVVHRDAVFGTDVFLAYQGSSTRVIVGAPLRFDPNGLRAEDWDEVADFGRIVAEASWTGLQGRVEARLGRPAVPGHRIRPDGFDLMWRQLGILDTMTDAQLPYFVAWDVDPAHHPSAGGHDAAIAELEIAGSPERISAWLGEPANHPLDEVEVQWLDESDPAGPGLVAVTLHTPRGLVRID